MPTPIRGPKNRAPQNAATDPSARPKIWVGGQQQPKLHLRAWARVALALTLRSLGPAMATSATGIDRFGQNVARGDHVPNLAWLGRAQRAIPSHRLVGAIITRAARLLASAKEVVLPAVADVQPIAYPNLIRPISPTTSGPAMPPPRRAAPRLAVVPAVPPETVPRAFRPDHADEPALRAIRSLIGETDTAAPDGAATTHGPAAFPQFPTHLQTIRASLNLLIWNTSVQMLAWGLVGVTFPIGAVKATLYHLNGGDLRDWS